MSALALRSAVPTEPCPYHVQREVDVVSGLAVLPGCRAGRETELRSFLTWPASVQRFLDRQHRLLPEVPSWATGCEPPDVSGILEITRPLAGQRTVLVPGLATDQQELPLEAETDSAGLLSWFVDGRLVGRAVGRERVWWEPTLGLHEIVVTDEAGRSASRGLEVIAAP